MFTNPNILENGEISQPDNDPRFWELLNLLPAAIYTCDADGRVTNFNEAAAELWGRRPVVGKDLWCGSWKIYHPDGTPLPLDQCPMAESLIKGKPIRGKELIIERPNGDRFFVQAHPHPLFDEKGVLTGALNMLVDITGKIEFTSLQNKNEELEKMLEELKRSEERLRRSEERYHRMVSEVEDYAIILLSVEGNIENWNKGAEKIKGYTADEIIGQNFSLFYPEKDQLEKFPQRLIQQAREKGKTLHEGWRVRKDGSRFWGSVVLTALHDNAGSVVGFTKVTRDLTEKKIAEEQRIAASFKLEQKNKELERMNEELSSFAYISSHDLQEPLRKIQTFSDRIMEMEYHNLSEKGKDYFHRMQRGALRMQKLIRDILSYSRTNTADKIFETTDLNELLAQSKVEMEVMIMEKKAVIESARLPTIKVIPFQFQQLFNNLLNNALKFSKDQVPPHIVIDSQMVDSDTLELPYPEPAKRYYHISFQDHGIGFEPIYEKKIFEVFQRLHGRSEYGGTGIGLAICKKIVENHQGILKAEGQLNEGATFHIYLPVEN